MTHVTHRSSSVLDKATLYNDLEKRNRPSLVWRRRRGRLGSGVDLVICSLLG